MKDFNSFQRRELRDVLMAGALAAVLTSVGSYSASAASARIHHSPAPQMRGVHTAMHGGKLETRRMVRQKLGASAIVSRRTARASAESSTSGIASTYSDSRTASGEAMVSGQMTAAHRTLPFGTRVTVVNNNNGRRAVVRINDRGPFVHGRVIDLSPAAARALGVHGLASVSLIVSSRDDNEATKTSTSDSSTPERVADDSGAADAAAVAAAQ